LKYINGRTNAEVGQLQDALHRSADHKKDVATAFLACTEDEERYSQAIITLTDKLDPDAAKKLFGKYNEIAVAVENVRNYLDENFQRGKQLDEKFTEEVARNLLHRGNELLGEFAGRIDEGTDISPLLEKLETTKTEVMLFTSTFKALHRSTGTDQIDLRDLNLAQFNVISGPDLKKQKKVVDDMRSIYQNNYRDRTEYPQEFSDALLNSFDTSLEDPDTRFYLLKHQGRVAAFCRFDHNYRDGKLDAIYFGSFNTSPAYWRGKVGETMIEQALTEELSFGVPIMADCSPMAPIAKKYIELGFVATREHSYKGAKGLAIELSPETNSQLTSKNLATDEIIKDAASKKELGNGAILSVYPAKTQPDFSLLRQGYVLARYFEYQDETYCVFERIKHVLAIEEAMPQAA
jgi:hypothetical protein